MKYPIDVEEYAASMMKQVQNPDEWDREVFRAIAEFTNRAYYAGLKDGREE